jgi:hypothetical protein
MTDRTASADSLYDSEGRPKGDPIAHLLLRLAETPDGVTAQDVAKAYFAAHRKAKDPDDGWRRYMTPVKQQMLALARAGRLELLRKGHPVPLDEARGLVRMRALKAAGDSA